MTWICAQAVTHVAKLLKEIGAEHIHHFQRPLADLENDPAFPGIEVAREHFTGVWGGA